MSPLMVLWAIIGSFAGATLVAEFLILFMTLVLLAFGLEEAVDTMWNYNVLVLKGVAIVLALGALLAIVMGARGFM